MISVKRQRPPAPHPQCSASAVGPPAAKAADFLQAVTYFSVPLSPGSAMLDHLKSRRKVARLKWSLLLPHMFVWRVEKVLQLIAEPLEF